MKKLTTPILLLAFLFIAWQAEKQYTYTLTEAEAINTFNLLQVLKTEIPKSTIPMKEAIPILNMADSIQKIIQTQYVKNHPDSTKTKK